MADKSSKQQKLQQYQSSSMSSSNALQTEKLSHPTADTISEYIGGLVNSQDVNEIIESQGSMLERFEKTNETLMRVNALSAVRYEVMSGEFRKHLAVLQDMKTDLDSVFKRIRILKQTISRKYPEQYEVCKEEYIPPDDQGS